METARYGRALGLLPGRFSCRALANPSQNYMVLHGHKNAVLEVQWTADGSQLLSCSADKVRTRHSPAIPRWALTLLAQTVRAWDAGTGQSVKKMGEHTGIVNSVCAARRGTPLLVSGSDDGTARLWDLRVRRCVQKFGEVPGSFPVTCVALGAGSETLFAGGVDNLLRAWDLRTGQLSLTLEGHGDTVTGCALSPDGSFLLSNAMDNTLRVWDVRPFAPTQRCVKVLTAHAHNFEKLLLRCSWSADGSKVSCGSADRMLYVWGADGALQYKLPGHKGSVNEAVFHPQEPIVASCSSDQTIYLGELAA